MEAVGAETATAACFVGFRGDFALTGLEGFALVFATTGFDALGLGFALAVLEADGAFSFFIGGKMSLAVDFAWGGSAGLDLVIAGPALAEVLLATALGGAAVLASSGAWTTLVISLELESPDPCKPEYKIINKTTLIIEIAMILVFLERIRLSASISASISASSSNSSMRLEFVN